MMLPMKKKQPNLEKEKNLNLHQMGNWVNREYMKRFFNYGDTQILDLSKNKAIVTARIGNRLFFDQNSITKFLNDNIEQKKN
jgi:hypothetical protein